jgi:hypothetical protein
MDILSCDMIKTPRATDNFLAEAFMVSSFITSANIPKNISESFPGYETCPYKNLSKHVDAW